MFALLETNSNYYLADWIPDEIDTLRLDILADKAYKFPDGKSAADMAKRFNDIAKQYDKELRLRVMRLENTSDEWKKREQWRIYRGVYELPEFTGENWFQHEKDNLSHFVHISKDDKRKLAYTPSAEYGQDDRQVRIRVGAYLQKYFSAYLSPEKISEIVAEYDIARGFSGEFTITQDADEIETVYVNGPHSCMSASMDSGKYQGSCHPARVYAGPDLAIAYLGDKNDATARAVVWPDKKRFSRIYGDSARLLHHLEANGYTEGYLWNARLQRIPCDYGFVMPYVDYHENATDCGDYIQLNDDGELCTQSEYGTTETKRCERCGDSCSEHDTTWIESSELEVCEHCRDNYYSSCDCCGEMFDDENMLGTDNGMICNGCYEDYYFTCDCCSEIFHTDSANHTQDETVCNTCLADDYFTCDCCGEVFSNGDKEKLQTPDGENICTNCGIDYTDTPCGEYIAEKDLAETACDCNICKRYRLQYVLAFTDDDIELNGKIADEFTAENNTIGGLSIVPQVSNQTGNFHVYNPYYQLQLGMS